MLAGLGVPGHEMMLLQKEIVERKMNIPEETIALGQKNFAGAYDILLKSDNDFEKLKIDIRNYFKLIFGDMIPENQLNAIVNQLSTPWLVDMMKYKPRDILNNVNCPLLALNGSKDVQVPAEENLKGIEKSLEQGGNKDYTITEIENLNHLFQNSETGMIDEYAAIEETFSPKALLLMKEWIINRAK